MAPHKINMPRKNNGIIIFNAYSWAKFNFQTHSGLSKGDCVIVLVGRLLTIKKEDDKRKRTFKEDDLIKKNKMLVWVVMHSSCVRVQEVNEILRRYKRCNVNGE